MAGFDSDLDGLTDIEEALRALTPGNLTFFDAGLASAIDFFQQAGPGANHVFFISDGVPNGGPFADESAVLRDPAGINATIRGIGLGAGAALDQIDLLDDGLANGSVERPVLFFGERITRREGWGIALITLSVIAVVALR